MGLQVAVEREEDIHTYVPANNGAGPLWCHGSTVVARQGDQVFVTGLETLPAEQPLNNCRWLLFCRDTGGWRQLYADDSGRTREPSPLALLGSGDLLVSANPTLAPHGAYNGPAVPTVFRFRTDALAAPPSVEHPPWHGAPQFTEHSYRTVTADRANGEVLYMQNVGYELAHMSFLSRAGGWQPAGEIRWPMGDRYDPPRPLRLCYPNVLLRDRAAHYFGVGDIVEPVPAWRQAKLELTGREWDYVFRRLFYAYTPDVTQQPFGPWIEVADRDATAGAMRNGDIHVDARGVTHLIWQETSVDERLRDRFFPSVPVVRSLEYMRLQDGKELERRTLARAEEGERCLFPYLGRFHVLADQTLMVLAAFQPNTPDAGLPSVVYRAALLGAASGPPEWVDVPFARPMPGTFLTSTVRGGSPPSDTIDLVGSSPAREHTLGYACLQLTRI